MKEKSAKRGRKAKLIVIEFSHDKFINDIHPLVRSFIPGEEIEVRTGKITPEIKNFDIRIEHDGEQILSFSTKDITDTDKLRMKNILKCRLYEELSEKLHKELPWGTLTGIRPVRLAMDHMEQGFSIGDTAGYMRERYLVSPEKAALSAEIAAKELNIISRVNEPEGFSLYVGIPFCPTTCLYCSFTSNAIGEWEIRVGEYLSCLEKEMKAVADIFAGKRLTTVYIGGGTPTSIGENELRRLMEMLHSCFDMGNLKEFTVEAGRPDSITPVKLQILKEYGADRLSVNPQSMNDGTLKKIGRCHTAGDTVRAFNEARDAGFENINMDIILGLPDEGEREVAHTVSKISELKPDDLTIHSLSVKRGSALKESMEKYGWECLKNTDSIMETAASHAKAMGLSPYYLYRQKNMSGNFENTGWAKDGKEGLYNILMMEEVQSIPAVGAGTVSKCVMSRTDIRRDGNVKDVEQYISRIDEMIDRKKRLYVRQICDR